MNEIKEETKDSKNHEKLNAQSLKILKKGLEDKEYAQKFKRNHSNIWTNLTKLAKNH